MTQRSSSPGTTVLLTRLSRVIYRRATEQLIGVTLKQFATLAHLRDVGEIAQQALGEMLCIDANNLVLLLNDLESAGFATRRRDPADRRRHIVAVTPAGLTALEHAEQAMGDIEDEVLVELSPEERGELRTLLARALDGDRVGGDRVGVGPAQVG